MTEVCLWRAIRCALAAGEVTAVEGSVKRAQSEPWAESR